MDTFPYLFAAYSLIWLVTFLYIFRLMTRQNQLRRELDSLKQAGKKE
jgi:CcmD family protein